MFVVLRTSEIKMKISSQPARNTPSDWPMQHYACLFHLKQNTAGQPLSAFSTSSGHDWLENSGHPVAEQTREKPISHSQIAKLSKTNYSTT